MTATPAPGADPDPAVLARIAELVRLEQRGERAQVAIGPWSAYTLIGALQLSLRHPYVNGQLRDTLAQIAHLLADAWFRDGDPLIYDQLQRGFDPTHDIHCDQTGWPDACPAPGFRCPRCAMVSHNPHDEINGYCGACRDFTGEEQAVPKLAVRGELQTDTGRYQITVTLGEDRAWTLEQDRVQHYARGCVKAATQSEQLSLIYHAMTAAGVPEPAVLDLVVTELVLPQAAADRAATAPLVVLAAVQTTATTMTPRVELELDGQRIGIVTPAQLRAHAGHVLTAAAAAELQGSFYQVLTTVVGLDAPTAATMIANLDQFGGRPTRGSTP